MADCKQAKKAEEVAETPKGKQYLEWLISQEVKDDKYKEYTLKRNSEIRDILLAKEEPKTKEIPNPLHPVTPAILFEHIKVLEVQIDLLHSKVDKLLPKEE